MNRIATISSFGFLAGTLAVSSSAHAWLGGFENADGYQPFLNMVQNYNAGHYGPNSGYGGGPSAITPNTDFWTAVQGGFFSGGAVSYATGHQNFDRLWWNNGVGSSANQALQLTTGHQGWGGPALEYSYKLDAPDLGGVAPSATGGTTIQVSFWWKGHLQGADSLGMVPEGYFGHDVQFRDSSNNVGIELGMTQRASGDKVTFWNGSTLFESALPAPAGKYDRWDITLNLATNTFSADYFQFFGSTLTNVVTNQPLMTPMSDFSSLDIRTSPGVTNEKSFGLAVDDFQMHVVPEPTTIAALGLVAAAIVLRRPRRA
ncbi:hypothetical protein BH09PLA1_BH09PLA1_21330 [soil metagenome]